MCCDLLVYNMAEVIGHQGRLELPCACSWQNTKNSFKSIPLKNNILSHSSRLCLHVPLEGFIEDTPQLCRHGLFDVVETDRLNSNLV